MLIFAHALLLWSVEARFNRRSSTLKYLTLVLSLVLCGITYPRLGAQTINLVPLGLSAFYAVMGRSWWPITLVPLTWSLEPASQQSADYLLQGVFAQATSWVLSAPLQDTTLEWGGVAVHVGPSCANLLMFQGAAMLAWLITVEANLRDLGRNILVLTLLGGALNLVRILLLSLAAPLAPTEEAWLWVHDGVSLGCSAIAIIYVWRRIQRPSASAPAHKSPHTATQ